MPISSWSTTPASNNSASPNGAPEGWKPSQVNDVLRQQMADHRTQWNDAEWIEYGTGTGVTTYSCPAVNKVKIVGTTTTTEYSAGRAIRIVGGTSGTVYGFISSSVANGAALDVTLTASILTSSESISSVKIGIVRPTVASTSLPKPIATRSINNFVIDFGGVPDGSVSTGSGTDNSGLLQSAINTIGAGGVLEIPRGTFKLSSQVIIPSNFTLRGAGNYNTILFAPTAFNNATGLLNLGGAGGPPTIVEDMCVSGQLNGAGPLSAGVYSAANGVIIRNIWCSGFFTNITLASSDNFLLDSISEQTISGGTGILVKSTEVTVANCLTYVCYSGLAVSSAAYSSGVIAISNVRSLACAYAGFNLISSSNIQLSNCSVGHNNNGAYTFAGLNIDTSSNVAISNFTARLANKSVAGIGIRAVSSSDISISNPQISNFYDGISQTACGGFTVTGGSSKGNARRGINLAAGDQVSVAGVNASGNGGVGTADAGIYSDNTAGYSTHNISGCITTQSGGGPQEYGIYANVADNGAATGQTNITGNTSIFNNTANINLVGRTDRIVMSGNIPAGYTGTMTAIASAANIFIPPTDVVLISGTVNITSADVVGCNGRTVRLIFQGVLTFTDGSNLKLAGNFVTTADDVITLVCDGTNWYEVSRSAN